MNLQDTRYKVHTMVIGLNGCARRVKGRHVYTNPDGGFTLFDDLGSHGKVYSNEQDENHIRLYYTWSKANGLKDEQEITYDDPQEVEKIICESLNW